MKHIVAFFMSFFVLFLFTGCFMEEKEPEEFVPTENQWLEGAGTHSDPFIIENAFDFYAIRYTPYSHYIITEDINFNEETFMLDDGIIVQGIKSLETSFYGSIDGQGHILTYSTSRPMFISLKGAKIENLVLNVSIEDELSTTEYKYYEKIYACGDEVCPYGFVLENLKRVKDYGLIASVMDNTTLINNIVLKGSILKILNNIELSSQQKNEAFVGFIAGKSYGMISNIQLYGNFSFELINAQGLINADFAYYGLGQVVGFNYGSVKNVSAVGTYNVISNGGDFFVSSGGIAGYNHGLIENIYVEQSHDLYNFYASGISRYGSSDMGGIVGNNPIQGRLKNIWFNGSLKNKCADVANVGGIAGFSEGMINHSFSKVTFDIFYMWTELSPRKYIGGILGGGNTISVDHTYYVKQNSTDETKTYGKNIEDDPDIKVEESQIPGLFSQNMITEAIWMYNAEQSQIKMNLDPLYWEDYQLLIFPKESGE